MDEWGRRIGLADVQGYFMITQEYLKSKFFYDASTGKFKKIGSDAKVGFIDDGYTRIEIDRKTYYAHRLAWLYVYGKFPELHLDHINCDKSDNRIENLREVTRFQNLMNVGRNKNNTSGLKNVYYHKPTGKWQVRVTISGNRSKYFGLFEDIELADLVAKEARSKYHGQFARDK